MPMLKTMTAQFYAKKILQPVTLLAAILTVSTGCQSMRSTAHKSVITPTAATTPSITAPVTNTASTALPSVAIPEQFTINGKIGITTPQQAGSAFYTWAQQGTSFAIDLAGALNAGQTMIRYNGQTATLTNEKGTLTAQSPEALLFEATQWQAPISQLPYWIMGQAAPSDSDNKNDAQSRLTTAYNGNWTADFSYDGNHKLPNRITMRYPDGYKVVLTINRLS